MLRTNFRLHLHPRSGKSQGACYSITETLAFHKSLPDMPQGASLRWLYRKSPLHLVCRSLIFLQEFLTPTKKRPISAIFGTGGGSGVCTCDFMSRSWVALQPCLETAIAHGELVNLLVTSTFSTLLPSASFMKASKSLVATFASSSCTVGRKLIHRCYLLW